MDKKKILKIVLIIILAIIIIELVNTLRKYTIIKDLQKKFSNYSSSTNFHVKSITTEEDGLIVTMNYYEKDIKQALILERDNNGEIIKMSMYDNGERKDIFYDTSEEKIAQLDIDLIMNINLYNYLEEDNDFETFLASIFAKVKKTEYNGKECYIINNFASPMVLFSTEKNEIYIEKDTGLFVKCNIDNIISEREYEFDNVDDSIFVELDIGKYTLKNND